MKLTFITRHKPTDGQIATVKALGYDGIETKEIVFLNSFVDSPVAQLCEIGIKPGDTVAVVAPLSVALTLLRAGYRLVEFQNEPSARQKGVFVCRGAWVHTLEKSQFISCPIPADAQEEGSLSPVTR